MAGTTPLSPNDTETLVALLSQALNFDDLQAYVYLGTGDRLYDAFVGTGLPKKPTLRKLIEALEEQRITDRFLRVVYQQRPYQTELRAFIVRLYPAIAAAAPREPIKFTFQKGGEPASGESDGPGLERNVKPHLGTLDAEVWLARFETIKRQVCRVEADGAALGTGFLVGPSAILTNWHVMREARRRGVAEKVVCRFDYRRLTDGSVDAGSVLKVEAVADERPCSDAELTVTPDTPPPAPDELDYALLKLDGSVPERGFLKLADPPPSGSHDPLIIVQHPNGSPLQFALDTDAVIGPVHEGLRLRYRTNTAPGSSGSPCFGMGWDLLALHHLGDPAAGPATYNQGVPVGLIRASILQRGSGNLLGG